MARPITSPAARSDLEQILTYLDHHSPPAADRFAVKADRIIDRIGKLPRIGRDRSDLRPGLRSVVIGDYILFYRIVKNASKSSAFFTERETSIPFLNRTITINSLPS